MSDTVKLNPAIAAIPMPIGIRALPIDPVRGMPVPWFVTWLDGKAEFRVADGKKYTRALEEGLCWTCGQVLPRKHAYLAGPMCAVNRVSAEPPSHRECAEYSVRACPFLSRPHMDRREAGLPVVLDAPGGFMLKRNPGCMITWMTKERPQPFDDGPGWCPLAPGPSLLAELLGGRTDGHPGRGPAGVRHRIAQPRKDVFLQRRSGGAGQPGEDGPATSRDLSHATPARHRPARTAFRRLADVPGPGRSGPDSHALPVEGDATGVRLAMPQTRSDRPFSSGEDSMTRG